ncbi:unnamed protein product, partial [Rotaria sp. Silwood1]
MGINNQRLEIIAQEQIFTNILNFTSASRSTDEICSISSTILNQFCIDILPRIHKNVKSLIVESFSMECIFGVSIYSNLTQLKIFNFNKGMVSRYFIDDSHFEHIYKQQITDLILVSNDKNIEISQEEYTKDVTRGYDNLILTLRRMSYVEELSLYIHILGGSTFISGIHLNNKILSHMPRLHTFSFYFASENTVADSAICISNSDIQQTFTNIKHRQIGSLIDYDSCRKLICRVFSLPYKFDRLTNITNNTPNIVFNSVTHLKLRDKYPFKHEFFIRLARGFLFLKSLSIDTILAPNWRADEYHLKHIDWCSIVEYPHLSSLDIDSANIYYAEHFLNETKTHLPCLTELKIRYEDLEMVTKNFTRNETRRNCTKVDPSKQQDEHWLFGEIGNDKQGFFSSSLPTPSNNVVDTTSQLSSGSWVMTLAECQGKTVDKHLSFQKGEFILVREQKDATWYSGQLNDKIGWFPRNYVRPATEIEIENNKNLTKKASISEKPLNLPTSNDQSSNDVDNGDVYETIYSYEATDSSDLSFDIGKRVIVLKRDRTGLFPNNYVQKVNNIQETAIAIT